MADWQIQDDIPVPKREMPPGHGREGGLAKNAKHRGKDKLEIQQLYKAMLEKGPVSDEDRETFITNMEEKYTDHKLKKVMDAKAIDRYLREIDGR